MEQAKLLAGKRGVISGALDADSIAWKVAERCVAHGAKITLTNAPVALRFGQLATLSEQLSAPIISADATNIEDLEALFTQSSELLGGKLDFVLHSIGMSLNVRKGQDYTNLKHDWMLKTFDISAISFHKMMQVLYNGDFMASQGSILACL
ncbi:MAG: SDR family oxidoreductase, partial [Lewinella sp.]|nr:SDR family oxidoreductase [Lewinella sp.]